MISAGWEATKLKYVADCNRHVLSETTSGDRSFKYIDIGAVGQGSITIPAELTAFADAPSRARRLAKPGDTIVSTVRTYLRAVATVPETDEELIFSTGFAVLHPRPDVSRRFLAYVLQGDAFVDKVVANSVGVSYPAIPASDLMALDLPLPPIDEQRAIADYLDQETTQIDALAAKQEEFIRLLRERRLSQITGVFSRLGEPNSELRRVAHVQSGVTLSGEGDPRHPTWPYLRVANVQMGRVDLEEVKEIRLSPGDAQASMLRAGDVLMTEGGDIDKLGRGTVWDGSIDPIVHQNHVFAVRVNRDRLVPEYLAWWLDSVTSRRYFYLTAKKTTNLASTNKTVVGRLPVSVPSVDEQRAIVRVIEEQTSRIDTLIAKAEEHIALAKERRSALITAAVTGQFDVRTARKAG
jgi:type I restriction enzyme S subunit